MNCSLVEPDLCAFVDEELTPPQRRSVAAHLRDCAACRARIESLRSLKSVVARLSSQEPPTRLLQSRVERLRSPDLAWTRLERSTLATVLGVAIALFLSLLPPGRPDPLGSVAADLVTHHVQDTDPDDAAAGVASGDAREVVRFFLGRTLFEPIAPSFPGTTLVGGRLLRIHGHRAQLLSYRREGQVLSLFVTDEPVGGVQCRFARGDNVCFRHRGEHTLMIVGAFPQEELQRLLDEAALR